MLVAGFRYAKVVNSNHVDGMYLVPTQTAYDYKGSCAYLPYGKVGCMDDLEETLHQLMREGKLAIPYNYSSSIKDIKYRRYSYCMD